MLQIQTLGHADAQRAISVIQAELARRGKAAAIAVVDAGGEVIATLRIDGTPLSCVNNATNKAFTSARERKPSGDIGKAARDPERGFDMAYFGDRRYIGFNGGLPVKANGVTVGGIGVSGLSGAEDEELAKLGVDAILAGA